MARFKQYGKHKPDKHSCYAPCLLFYVSNSCQINVGQLSCDKLQQTPAG